MRGSEIMFPVFICIATIGAILSAIGKATDVRALLLVGYLMSLCAGVFFLSYGFTGLFL